MRILIALLVGLNALLLCSCAGPCEMGANCWVSGQNGLTVQMRGTAEFTDDDRDIKSLSPGGFVRVQEGNWVSPERVYEVRADWAGKLSRTYEVDGSPKQMNSSAQAWVASAMLYMIRESGVGAAARVQRILRTGGPDAVLAEVGQINSDGSKRSYLQELVMHGHLNDDQLRDALRSARRISSDGDKCQFLIDVADQYLRPNLREPWFSVVYTISSDGDKRRALENALRQDAGSAETLVLASKGAGSISSDGDKAQILTEVAEDYKPEARQAWFRAANSISSDGDRAHALSILLRAANGQPDTMVDFLDCARAIASDGDKAHLLSDAAQYPMKTAAVQHAFFAAANSISSDGDRGATLSAVLRNPDRNGAVLAGVAESAAHISSDGDKAALLSHLAESPVDDPVLRDAFFAAVNTINSDGDRANVLTRVIRQPGASPEMVVAAIESAASISSDGDKATVLVLAADTHAGTPAVRAALQKALESVHSDGDYRRVSSALIRKTT